MGHRITSKNSRKLVSNPSDVFKLVVVGNALKLKLIYGDSVQVSRQETLRGILSLPASAW